jgi:hypothetical protein
MSEPKKYTIKNRPKLKTAEGGIGYSANDAVYLLPRIDEWFEGFEKQLREMLADRSKGAGQGWVSIKEILGDSE